MDADRGPALLQQSLDVGIAQRPKFVYEANPREELRVSRNALFDARHANEHHTKSVFIEDRAHLFQGCSFACDLLHRPPINWSGLELLRPCSRSGKRSRSKSVSVGWIAWYVVAFLAMRGPPHFIATPKCIKHCSLFSARRMFGDA